jgi:hypothetical protein
VIPFEEFVKATKTIPRAVTERHAWILYGLVKWLRPQTVIEIGSWFGYTAAHIARALQENGKGRLWCVDDFSLMGVTLHGHNENLRLCGVKDSVSVSPSKSSDWFWPDADMVFIDGDHSYEGCLHDFEMAAGSGATCIVLHDTSAWWGPSQVLMEKREGWSVLEVDFDEGLAIFLKPTIKPELQYHERDFPMGRLNEPVGAG